MKKLLFILVFLPSIVLANEMEINVTAPIDPSDQASLQRGARTFINNCLNCHSANYMRYNRLQDIGLTEKQIKDNLLFAGEKVGDTMKVAINKKDAKKWFGVCATGFVGRSACYVVRTGFMPTCADFIVTRQRPTWLEQYRV